MILPDNAFKENMKEYLDLKYVNSGRYTGTNVSVKFSYLPGFFQPMH